MKRQYLKDFGAKLLNSSSYLEVRGVSEVHMTYDLASSCWSESEEVVVGL
jgi:hypothetical protein